MTVVTNEKLSTVLSYLGFPKDLKTQIAQRANLCKTYQASFSFDFVVECTDFREELMKITNIIFNKLIESDPVQNIINEKDNQIHNLKEENERLEQTIKELSEFKHYFDKAKELK